MFLRFGALVLPYFHASHPPPLAPSKCEDNGAQCCRPRDLSTMAFQIAKTRLTQINSPPTYTALITTPEILSVVLVVHHQLFLHYHYL